MKDFDAIRAERQQRDGQTFKLAGQQFTLKPDMPARAISDYADLDTYTVENGQIPPGTFDTLARCIGSTLVTADQERWHDLLAQELENPITLEDMLAVANFMVEVTAHRPTKPLSSSGDTAGNDGRKSTDDSGSPAETAPTPLASVAS